MHYAHHVLYRLATSDEVPPSADELSVRSAAVIACALPYLVGEPANRHTIEAASP